MKKIPLFRFLSLFVGLSTLVVGAFPALGELNDNQKRMHIRAWQDAQRLGLTHGVRGVELIRPDLIELRMDWGLVGQHSREALSLDIPVEGPPSVFEATERFVVKSKTDPAFRDGVAPEKVYLISYQGHNYWDPKANWPLYVNIIYWHDAYLFLPTPMTSGHTYTVEVLPPEPVEGMRQAIDLDYDETTTTSKAFKINQVGYLSKAERRYAYLGWWAGRGGGVDYAQWAGGPFLVINEATGATALEGTVKLRREADELSGEDIYEMDIAALGPGRYHIQVPGLARSETFQVGGEGVRDLHYHTARAYFHQRSGQELAPPHTWVERVAGHTSIWESGVPREGFIMPHVYLPEYTAPEGMSHIEFTGGYHDAADFDTFTYHLPATMQLLTVYEQLGEHLKDSELDIPESGNGVPDILDEAEWALKAYLFMQREDGAVPLGRVHMADALTQNMEVPRRGKAIDKPHPPYGIIPPTRNSTETFAAAAAQFARLIEPYDSEKAKVYTEAARRAYEHAVNNTYVEFTQQYNATNEPKLQMKRAEQADAPNAREQFMLLAATQLAITTNDPYYRQQIEDSIQGVRHTWPPPEHMLGSLALADPAKVGADARDAALNQLLERADRLVRTTEEAGYRMGNGNGTVIGWGRAQGVHHSPILMSAYFATGEQKYLDAASLNADFHLGTNPLSKSTLTGMGYRPPTRPQISYYLYDRIVEGDLRGGQVKGIGIYGIGPPFKFSNGDRWPLWRSWREVWGRHAEIYNEFTLHQTIGPSAATYSAFYGLERKHGLDPESLPKPDPLERPTHDPNAVP